MIFLAMASEESLIASLSSTLRVRLSMLPGLASPAVPFALSRDREGHVKQKVSRREPPLLIDVILCVGVILPVDVEVESVDDDGEDK